MGKKNTLGHIQKRLFRTQIILVVTLALFLGCSGILLNLHFEKTKRDQNLQNVAQTIARSPLTLQEDSDVLMEYLDSLKGSLSDIDVISVVSADQIRLYHSNHSLIGTKYDGTMPDFSADRQYCVARDTGPSGVQRRAYAAIYDKDGNYRGFVIAVMLMENIKNQTVQAVILFFVITVVAVLIELTIFSQLSKKIKQSLLGYEPDAFTAMYQVRDNILESLKEGILAVDNQGIVQFANQAALTIMEEAAVGKPLQEPWLEKVLKGSEREFGIPGSIGGIHVLADRIPVQEDGRQIGAVGILHNRTEYTKLMEDLSGTRYLVDSMRANNHDFTNKLHVILGLIQMEMYQQAMDYIQNITMVQRATISAVMHAVDEPAVAALLIGKTARAAELNVKFILLEGSCYSKTHLALPAETLVTIIGNLIDNAYESMNSMVEAQKELQFGIYSKPDEVLITVDDTGEGIADKEKIFENGFSTKGQGRGTGLYQVKSMVEALGGTIAVESQVGVGTSFSVSFRKQ